MRHAVDIDSSRGDVGSDQNPNMPPPEAVERAHPLILALVAMDRLRANPRFVQMVCNPIGTAFSAGEDDCTRYGFVAKELSQNVAF